MTKRTLKVFLKRNFLVEAPNNYSTVLSSNRSLTQDDLIDEMIAEGIQMKRDKVKNVVTRFNKKAADKTLSGFNVNTGLVYMRPMVRGTFYDRTWNPEVNPVYVSIMQGIELRTAVSETEVYILGEQVDPLELYTLKDSLTGAIDGTLTKGRNAELRGAYIKLAGDDPAVGITLRNTATQTEKKLAAEDIVLNEPSRLLLYIPLTLEAGEYELTLTTQFTGSDKLLKRPRSVTLGLPVVVA